MKILIITPYKDFIGGVEMVNSYLQNIFEAENHTVDYLTTDGFVPDSIMKKLLLRLVGLPFATSCIFKGNKHLDYDVIIANGEYGYGIKHDKAMIINLFHGCDIGYRNYLKEYWSWKNYLSLTRGALIQKLSTRHKKVIVVSGFVKEIFIREKIVVDLVITNAIDTNIFFPDYRIRNSRCLFVGSCNYYPKGIDVLEDLSNHNIQIDCITNKPIHQNLTWLGNKNNEELVDYYREYSLLIFPSRFEGLGLVALEAMACGMPILMREVGIGCLLKEEIPEFVTESFDESIVRERKSLFERERLEFTKKAIDFIKKHNNCEDFKNKWLSAIGEPKNGMGN